MSADSPTATRITLYRDAGSRAGAFVRAAWRRRWVKILAIIVASPFVLYFLLLLIFARGLPSAESLLTYQPPLPSSVRAEENAWSELMRENTRLGPSTSRPAGSVNATRSP